MVQVLWIPSRIWQTTNASILARFSHTYYLWLGDKQFDKKHYCNKNLLKLKSIVKENNKCMLKQLIQLAKGPPINPNICMWTYFPCVNIFNNINSLSQFWLHKVYILKYTSYEHRLAVPCHSKLKQISFTISLFQNLDI